MRSILLYAVIITATCLSSCKKKEEVKGCMDSSATNYNSDATVDDESCTYTYNASTEFNQAKKSSEDLTTAIYQDIQLFTYVQYETDNNDSLGKMASGPVPSCAIIQVEKVGFTAWPKKLSIDFGSTNCLCDDGKYRRGTIEARINDSWITSTGGIKDSMVITLTNYYVNDTMITGTRTYIKDSISLSKMSVSAVVTDGGVIFPGNDTIQWSYTSSFDLTFGNKADYNDNVLSMSVNGSLNNKGLVYSLQTTENLVAQFNCLNTCLFVSGNLSLSNTETQQVQLGNKTYEADVTTVAGLNFGTGTCDGIVDLSVTATGKATANGATLFNETTTEQINCSEMVDWE